MGDPYQLGKGCALLSCVSPSPIRRWLLAGWPSCTMQQAIMGRYQRPSPEAQHALIHFRHTPYVLQPSALFSSQCSEGSTEYIQNCVFKSDPFPQFLSTRPVLDTEHNCSELGFGCVPHYTLGRVGMTSPLCAVPVDMRGSLCVQVHLKRSCLLWFSAVLAGRVCSLQTVCRYILAHTPVHLQYGQR